MRRPLVRLGRACAILTVLGATACGPETGSSIRMTSRPVDVVFGDRASHTSAPIAPVQVAPGANQEPHFPTLIDPQLPDFDHPTAPRTPVVLPTTTPSACPTEARPGLKEVAPLRITKRPVPATYVYARTGTAQRTLPSAAAIQLDGLITRAYGIARAADPLQFGKASFLFDVTEASGRATVVNTYLVSPQGSATPAFGAGLYLSKVESSAGANDGTDVFAPTTPLLLMPFPASEGATWHSTATDPRSQVTIEVDGLVRGKQRINFCGQGVDSWDIKLTGSIAGPGKLVNIRNLVYQVGTQYGGVFLHDELDQDGTDLDGQYTSRQAVGITREPDAAT
ncbi:MAG: hypothetical protein ABR549_16350 [Mycobacteriales bacterium]